MAGEDNFLKDLISDPIFLILFLCFVGWMIYITVFRSASDEDDSLSNTAEKNMNYHTPYPSYQVQQLNYQNYSNQNPRPAN